MSFLFLYALVFAPNGFETLSTGSDEVMYGMEQEELMHNVHRGTPDDSPIMRLDHYVQDYPAREISHYKDWRRGPDMLTVTTAMLLNVPPQRVYPITFGALTLVLAMSVLFLCQYGFNMRLRQAWPVPIFFLISSGLWTLNVQGNFNNLSSWPLFLLGPWFLLQALRRVRLRWVFPFALIVASVYSFYYEPALVSLLLPCGLAILYCVLWRRTSPLKLLLVAGLLVPLVLMLNPTFPVKLSMSTEIAARSTTIGGFAKGAFAAAARDEISWLRQSTQGWRNLGRSDWWPHATNVLFGMAASIDVSELNTRVRNNLLGHPLPCLLSLYAVYTISCFGLFHNRRPVGIIGGAVMIVWFLAAHMFVMQKQFFTFYRSAMYTMPFAILGLGLAFSQGRVYLQSRPGQARLWGGILVGLTGVFLFVNAFTSGALGAYVWSHSVCDDRWIRRTNPDAAEWRSLRSTLSQAGSPILISGFIEPQRLLWLGSGIKPLAHFMGKSSSDAWVFGAHATPNEPFYPVRDVAAMNRVLNRFYTRRSKAELIRMAEKENTPWNEAYRKFLAKSVMAMVPPRHDWPAEWEPRTDIFGPMVLEFPNIAAVVYRGGDAFSVSDGLGPLSEDRHGRYREFIDNTQLAAQQELGWVQISVIFDGAPHDLNLTGEPMVRVDKDYAGVTATESFFRVQESTSSVHVTLAGKTGTKIRSITMRVVPVALGCRACFQP
ncbi:MAG TPA: hypothetical protein VEV17_09815 [Bryobacteraceae bacterium]|nr:hypothetical protein [Bryobacteraceae bacterium]